MLPQTLVDYNHKNSFLAYKSHLCQASNKGPLHSTPLHSRAKEQSLFRTNLTHNRGKREKGKYLMTFKRVSAHTSTDILLAKANQLVKPSIRGKYKFSCMDEFKKTF